MVCEKYLLNYLLKILSKKKKWDGDGQKKVGEGLIEGFNEVYV